LPSSVRVEHFEFHRIESSVAHRIFVATKRAASVKVVPAISVLDQSRNLLCSVDRNMESDASKKAELAAFMLAAWAHPLKKRLPVKEAMLNVGFTPDLIEDQKWQMRIRRRAKELEKGEEALPVVAVLTKKKGEDSDTSPLTNSTKEKSKNNPSLSSSILSSIKRPGSVASFSSKRHCSTTVSSQSKRSSNIGGQEVVDVDDTEDTEHQNSKRKPKKKATRLTPHQLQAHHANTNMVKARDNEAHKEATRLWKNSKLVGKDHAQYATAKEITAKVNAKYDTSLTDKTV
jgi:hypothetical protein